MLDSIDTDIAIVGMAGHFPRAQTLGEFWSQLVAARAAARELTEEELERAGVPSQLYRQARYVRRALVLERYDEFDAAWFGFSPREAELLNPEQRLLLQCSQHALDDAGYDSHRYARRIGVFVGAGGSSYLHENLMKRPDLIAQVGSKSVQIGNDPTFSATHVAYRLRLRGPAIAVQTACSTSLVAVHLACRSLLEGECDMALAGAAHLSAQHGRGYMYQEGGILSRDGNCRPFDSEASGTISGSGAGAVLLKRLEDALADGDRIVAVIQGSAINNDGADKVGFTAPSVRGQTDVIRTALDVARVEPQWIGLHEAHGTATALGDPIEFTALTAAHRAFTKQEGYCALGALKANLGHMGTAAGIGGLIKLCLSFQNELIVPLPHFRSPNPALDVAGSPFRIPTRPEPWVRGNRVRYASLSSFGMGGTNAHAILREPPLRESLASRRSWHIWPLSASSPAALSEHAQALTQFVQEQPAVERADAAHTLAAGRRQGPLRDFLLVSDTGEVRHGGESPTNTAPVKVAWLIPGQGSQFPGMARRLYEVEPVFRDALEACLERLECLLPFDLRTLLLDEHADANRLQQTDAAQPALFAMGYASATLWRHWGVPCEALLGHSVGEIIAACLSGALDLDNACSLVVERGRVMQGTSEGRMLAVAVAAGDIERRIGPLTDLDIAAINTPASCVLSGEPSAITEVAQRLQRVNIATSELHTVRAFHSRHMQGAAEALRAHVATLHFGSPNIPCVSSLTGTWLDAAQLRHPHYWSDQVRSCVRFADGIETLRSSGYSVLIELGPGQSLTRALNSVSEWRTLTIVPSSRHAGSGQDDEQVLAHSLARLWVRGVPVDLTRRYADEVRARARAPVTCFARDRHWIEPLGATPTIVPEPAHVNATDRPALYVPTLKRALNASRPSHAVVGDWVLAGDEDALTNALAREMSARGAHVVTPDELPKRIAHPTDSDPVTIVYCALTAEADAAAATLAHLTRYLQFIQQVSDCLQQRGVRLVCLTRSGMSVAESVIEPSLAAVGAATRVVRDEFPGLQVIWIDVDAQSRVDHCARRVLDEIARGEEQVALRGAQRWVPDYIQLPDVGETGPAIRAEGYYLITGGLGGIGLALAEHLVARGAVNLVLTSRRELTSTEAEDDSACHDPWAADCARRVRALRSRGIHIAIERADVSDRNAMSAALVKARSRFGACRGVVHAAGSVGGGVILRLDAPQLRETLAAKVDGVLLLRELLAAEPLDFVLLCSSMNALKGGFGRFAYCAANAFMDAYAQHCARDDLRTVVQSLNWSAWAETGMAARRLGANVKPSADMLTTSEALAVFDRVIAFGTSQLVTAKVPLSQALRNEQPRTSVQEIVLPPTTGAADPQRYGADEELERRIAELWREVLGVRQIGFDTDFFELGGNSLTLIQMGVRVQERFAIELPVKELFACTTVAQLAQVLRPRIADAEAALQAMLEQLPSDELEVMLAQCAEEK
jgi:phthiocerol/phenolphthiocerol synthesis type-I polyketide synthase E